jgi:hypothetical protein
MMALSPNDARLVRRRMCWRPGIHDKWFPPQPPPAPPSIHPNWLRPTVLPPAGQAGRPPSLTDDQAAEVCAVYRPRHPEYGAMALATIYGVHRNSIMRAIARQTESAP